MPKKKFEDFANELVTGEIRERIKDFNVGLAKKYCPVEKGDLRDSIHGEVDKDGRIIVWTNDPKSEWIENGTRPMIRAHGEHDPHNPVKEWEAKRLRGDTDMQQMPFIRPAAYVTVKQMNKFIPKKISLKLRVVIR